MRFVFGKQDLADSARRAEHCFLLTNGLGGFCSQTLTGGAARNDHALLMACTRAPNVRWNIVHRVEEELTRNGAATHLSTQTFAKGSPEEGWQNLCFAQVDGLPRWVYQWQGVQVEKELAMDWEQNTVALRYQLENPGDTPCTLTVTPWLQFVPKGKNLRKTQTFTLRGNRVTAAGLDLTVRTNGQLTPCPLGWQTLYYPCDAPDGRRKTGLTAACLQVVCTVAPGSRQTLDLVFTLEKTAPPAARVLRQADRRCRLWERQGGFRSTAARQLAQAGAAFIARRDSTGGKTILAGYPFFEDWGRDTMIALPGCTLSTGRYAEAKSILETFLQYEQDGLMPNLFPEGKTAPMYNTVDAALLFIRDVWLYARYTGDLDFVRRAWPVMERIVAAYRSGTRFGIHMEPDGLIAAGQGLDQVTWMDVRIGEILPTPRHGKPVEINAYWYNALRMLEELAATLELDGRDYAALADRVRESFRAAFWREEAGCLRDVISGTGQDEQIRCNQIWAVAQPFPLLDPGQEARVVATVQRELYTPVGLRTLAPGDPAFHPVYGGPQKERDLAYHQGTVWPFPLGAFYLAYLKVNGHSAAARRQVVHWLTALEPALREGCVGQLPEIYDGENPTASRGCFAQAWSVGELLRVYEALERSVPDFFDHK